MQKMIFGENNISLFITLCDKKCPIIHKKTSPYIKLLVSDIKVYNVNIESP